jgi:hypothetical protein
MIIVDYSGLAMSSMFSLKSNDVDEGMLRHLILNSLRMYNVKYRAKFGKLVLACDGCSWRKNAFPNYKAARSINRKESPIDWDAVWRVINLVREEIMEHMPYKVVQVRGAEADDIVAVLVESTQEFGQGEPVMIVSADHDFIQLQKYTNVSQFSPMTKKLVSDKNPRKYLLEHIFRGCGGDGVPNVLSPDDVFIDATKRQKPLKAKLVDEWIASYSKLESIMDADTYRNYLRNRECIDLSYIPSNVVEEITACYESQPDTPNAKVFNYLVSKGCRMLVGSAAEFFPPKQ